MIKFETGKTYVTGSAVNSDAILSYEVMARTEKTVKVNSVDGVKTCRVKPNMNGTAEVIYPDGKYSMCTVLDATDLGA